MNSKNLLKIFISIIVVNCGCTNSKDNDIIINKYIYDLTSERHSIVENSWHNPKTKNIIPLLDTIIKQVEETETVSDEIKKKIYTNIVNWKNDKVHVPPPEPYEHLNHNKSNFLNGKMSKIQTLDFIEKYFLFNYWIHWSCDFSSHKLASLVELDTLSLRPNREYELQIQIQYNGIPSIRILSNTLQGLKPNRIKFKTDKFSNHLKKIPFRTKAINHLNRQIYTFTDTIKYFTIKNE